MPANLAGPILKQRKEAEPQIDIYLDNWPAFQLFMAMRTQWNVHGYTGVYLGLKYESLPFFSEWRDAEDRGALERKIRTLERAAMNQWAEDRD